MLAETDSLSTPPFVEEMASSGPEKAIVVNVPSTVADLGDARSFTAVKT